MPKVLDINPEQVKALAGIQCTVKEMCAVLGCSRTTIFEKYKNELREGRRMGKAELRRLQWNAAKDGNTGMLIWLGKQWLGQTDVTRNDIITHQSRIGDFDESTLLAQGEAVIARIGQKVG